IRPYASAGEAPIAHRLRQLDHEWDIERTLETNAAAIALAGVVLAATVDKRFLLMPGVVTAFLLQHALQGWCPPVPLFRHLGVRTPTEVEQERCALKALGGDFRNLPLGHGPPAAPVSREEATRWAAGHRQKAGVRGLPERPARTKAILPRARNRADPARPPTRWPRRGTPLPRPLRPTTSVLWPWLRPPP